MHTYFTSDLHFGSHNINGYCDRPFTSAVHARKILTNNINSRCKPEDVLYHNGDFILYGKERGVESIRLKPEDYLADINCTVVHITGNHDANNGLKGGLLGAYIKLSKNVTAWIEHYPPWVNKAPDADVYLCGHVHNSWKTKTYNGKLVINVGCDVWNYRPVRKDELIKFIFKK